MNFSIFKIFQIFGIVSNWAAIALADGKITLKEAVQLAMKIAEILGVEIEIDIPESVMTGASVDPGIPGKVPLKTWVPEEPANKPIKD